MDLKIKDVADLLSVSETTIRRWLGEGKIPAYRINQQYRFSRTEIEDWVINTKQGKATEATFNEDSEERSAPGNKQFSLFRAIHKGNVLKNVPGKTKEEVISATMKLIAGELNVDADVITELLVDRERLQPTALNNGIGIPHTRDFLLSSHHNVVVVVYPEKTLEYGALDGKPVHTLFFLFACDDKKHLHILAKIAHFSSQPECLKFLQSKPNKEALLTYIKEWEGNLKKS
ncbi:MAG: PTS sugar transporter subunit IIA [Parachlamydiaceae bacterium]|nr:PTS sugar transporter subunit IIA [Parachlamydiaceae bacterium]